MTHTFKKGEQVLWREWIGVVHSLRPTKVYVLFYGG